MTKAQERELIKAYSQALKAIRADIAMAFEKYDGNYTEMTKYNRLRNLEGEIGEQIRILTGKSATNLKRGAMQSFAETYYRTGFVLETEAAAKLGFGMLNPNVIEKAIINPFDRYGTRRKDSLGFLVRNSDNSKKLFQQLRQELTQSLIQGKSYQDTARIIKKRMETGTANVLRIARTENHRCQVLGAMDAYDRAEAAGVDLVRVWSATLDEATREEHGELDGQKENENGFFELDGDEVEGPGLTGDPKHDINCRCRVLTEIEGYSPKLRRVRGEGVVPHKTYNEWKNARIKK